MSRNQEAGNAAKRRQKTASIRPGIEQLESRLVPAKVVTTLLDTTNASTPTPGSLRAAVTSNVPSDFTVEFNDYLFAASIGVTHNPTALALGNFRGAGKNDVVSASRFTGSLSFSPDDNRGLGFLSQASTDYSASFTTSNIQALEAAELDSDGKTDIVTLGADGSLRAYLGNGNGTFTLKSTIAVGSSAAIALGDFNKDGKVDFATALTGSTGKVVFAMGKGDGTFEVSQTVTLSGTGSGNLVSLAVGDVTGDGTDDVVSLSSAGVLTTLPGVASGSTLGAFAATTIPGSPFTFLALGDLDNDGRVDAVAVNSASGILTMLKASTTTSGAFLTTGTGISTATLATGAAPGLVRVADLNADGKADLAVTQFGLDNVAVYTGKGDGTLNSGPATFDVVDPTDIRVRDMNADGLPDIVASSETSQSFAVFTNSGSASFNPVASKQATFILNGAVGAITDTLNNNLTITAGNQFGPGQFDASGNSLANLPRAIIQADAGFNLADYDLTRTSPLLPGMPFFDPAVLSRGSGFKVGDILQQGITSRQGGARFQVTGVDAAGGVTTIRVLQPGSQTFYDPFSAANTQIDPRLSQAGTKLSQSSTDPYFRLMVSSGTGTGLVIPTYFGGESVVVSKSLAGGVATINTLSPHGFSIGQTVTISIGDPAFNGSYTIASIPTTTSFTYARTGTLPATIINSFTRSLTGNVATINTFSAHGLVAGQTVSISIGDPTFDGTYTVTSVGSSTSFRYTRIAPDVPLTLSTFLNKSLTNNLATITTLIPHGFGAGQTININIGDAAFDGPVTITSVMSSTTFTYAVVNPDVPLTSSTTNGTASASQRLLTVSNRSSGLFFQNTPPSRSLTLDGLSLRASLDNTITVTQGSLTVSNSTFDDLDTQFGTSRGNRHFINLQTGAGSLTVANSRFENSRVDAIRGGSSGTISISGSSFSNNDGQALNITAGTVNITGSTFTNNGDLQSAISQEIYGAATQPLGDEGIIGGRGMNAAGTVNAVTITVSSSLFDNNRHATIPSLSRALYLGGGTINVSNSIFRNHTNNGALELKGTKATVTTSQFENNASPLTFNTQWPNTGPAQGDRLRGGAAILIRDATPLTLSLSRFYNNKVDNIDSRFSGGGAVYLSSGTATISECAFENNSATISDYPNSGSPAFNNPETSPTARYSGGGALYAGGATVIRDSYFTNNSVLSYVDLWNPSYKDASAPTQPQFSGGGAVMLTRNLDSAITSDVFNTTFVGNFVQQVEANKDINRAGKQRLDSSIGYIPLDAASIGRNTGAQSVGINDGGMNRGQVVDGSDAVTETVLTTSADNNNTIVNSSTAPSAASLPVANLTLTDNQAAAIRGQDIPTATGAGRTATYQLSGRYVTASTNMTAPTATTVTFPSLTTPWFQSGTPMKGDIYSTAYTTIPTITSASTANAYQFTGIGWNTAGGQLTGTLNVNGTPQQTFTFPLGAVAATFSAVNIGTPSFRATSASFAGTTLNITLNPAPAATDVISITNVSFATTARTKIQTFTFDGPTNNATFSKVGTPSVPLVTTANYSDVPLPYSPATLSFTLASAPADGTRYSADVFYPQGLISRIVHTTVSGAVMVGGAPVQTFTTTADGTVVLSNPVATQTFALSGRLDLNTGLISMVWNTATPSAGVLTINSASSTAVSTSLDNGVRIDYRQSGIIDLAAADGDNDTDTDFAYITTGGTLQVRRNVRIEPTSTNNFGYLNAIGGTITLSGNPVSLAMGKMGAAGEVAVLRKTSTDNSGFSIITYPWDTTNSTWSANGSKVSPRLPDLGTPWTKLIGADVDGNGLMDLVAFNPGAGVARVFYPTTDGAGNYFYYLIAESFTLATSATNAIAGIFGTDPNPYSSISVTDIAVSQLNGGGNLDISASLKLVSSDPTRPTDAVMMLSGGTANVYFVKNNRLDVLNETMNIRGNQIFDYRLDEQSTNSGIDASGSIAAAGSYLADPSRLNALGVLQPITFAPRADLLGKPISGVIYADNTPIQRFFYDNAAGTFQFQRIGISDEFVTSASLAGNGALTLNWNSDYGATHVAVRDAAFTNIVTENNSQAVTSVDPGTNALAFAADPNLSTGTVVTLAGTGTATGLFVGGRYFVIRDTAATVRLAASALEASLGKAIDITAISSPSFSLIPEDKSVTFTAVGSSFRSNTVAAYVAGSFTGFVYVNGTVVQSFTVGAGGAITFNQVSPSIYLAVPTGSSYDLLTGVLTLAFNRDISTVPVRASVTNELAASVTDFAAIPTTTLYDNAQTFVTSGSVSGTIYSGSTPVQTFSTGNKTTELTNTVAVLAGATSTTFAPLAHPVSTREDNYLSNIPTSLTGNQFARGVIQINGQPDQSFTLVRGTNTGDSYPIQLTGGTTTPVASGTFNIKDRVLTITWATGSAPAANVAVSMTYTTPDMIFNFTKVGNPSVFVTAATLDPITHAFSLVWNGNPEQSRIDYSFNPSESFIPHIAPLTLVPAAGEFTISAAGTGLPGRNTTFRISRNTISTGSLNGTIYLDTIAVQTFEFSETGTLRLADIGNPAVKVTAGVIDHATGTFSLFWNSDVSAASPNAIVAYRQAYGVGPTAGFGGQNFFTGNANLSNSTYFGSGAGFGSLGAGSLPNLPSTGRGLNGGAILVSEGRQVTGLVTANEAARAGSLSVRVYNSTIVANTLSNPFAMNTSLGFPDSTYIFDPTRGSRQDTAPGSNDKAAPSQAGIMGDSGGLFNDTASGSGVRLLNTAVVSNTGLRYYSISAASALTFTGFARITQQDLAARSIVYGPGTFVSQGSTLYRPTNAPGFNNVPVTGDLIQTDQQTNFDSFTLVDTDNFRPSLLGPSFSNIGSTQYQYSETETQKIKYLALSRLSPGRDAGTGTVGGVSVPSLLNGTGTDIRGANRTVNNAIDIGAFETQVASTTTLLTATTPGQSGGNPVVVNPFEYGQPINLSLKSAWNDNVPPTAAVSGTVSVVRSTDSKVLGVTSYGTPVNPADISTGKSATVIFNNGNAQYPTLLDIGTNSLIGVFSGDQNYATSQTTPFNLVITKATTSVTLDPLTRVLSGSPVTITGFVSTPNSLAPLAGEGGLVIEYKAPGAVTYTPLTSPSLTLTGSNPNKYSFSVTVGAGTFNPLGTYDIRAKFVAGGLNHYTNSDNDTFVSTSQDVVDQAKIGLLFLNGSKTAVPSPATFPHFTQFYIRAVLATGIDATKRTGTVDLLDSAGTTVFSFPASDPNLTVSTGTASGLAAQGIVDGTAVTFLDYSFANNTAATSLGLRADDLISARYNGYPTPGTNFYLGATTATQSLDLPGIKANLALSTTLPFSIDPLSGIKTYNATYGKSYNIVANLDDNGTGAQFNNGTVSLVDTSTTPLFTTVGSVSVPSGTSTSFNHSFPVPLPTSGTIRQYDATYSGDGFNYDPLISTNPTGVIRVNIAKAATAFTTTLPATVYRALSASVPLAVNLDNGVSGFDSTNALKPTGTVSFYATPTSGGTRLLLGTSANSNALRTNPQSGAFTFNYTTTAGGQYDISIDYSGDGNYLSLSNQIIGTLIVPTIALSLGGNPANVARGAMVNFTATVTPAGTQSEQPGSVTFSFLQGATVVATAVVPRDNSNPGTYTLSTQLGGGTLNLPNGTYTVTASYAQGSGDYPNMVSAARTLNVGLAFSTTTLTATTASTQYRYGESIALAATVAGAVGLPFGPANSTVSIFDGTTSLTPTPLAINAANASAPATQTQTLDSKTLASALSVGSHSFQARYSGDGANYLASNSSVQSLNIVKADTTIAVSGITPASGIVASGGALTLQVTLSTPSYVEANAARPTGTVVFATGGTTLGTANVVNGVATLNINPTAIGNFSYTATYSGDGNYNAPSTPAQGSYTVASLGLSPLASSIIQRGSLLTLSAAVTPATGNNSATPLGSVSFVIPGTTDTVVASVPLSSASNGVYSTTIDTGNPAFNLPVGAYNLVARYFPATGDAYPAMNSASQSLTVNRQDVILSGALAATTIPYGSTVPLGNASIAPGINPSSIAFSPSIQAVDLYDGQTFVAQIPFNDGFRTLLLPTTVLDAGVHNLQLRYAGDANYRPATLTLPALTVTQAGANVSLSASATSQKAGQPFTFTAQVSAAQSGLPTSPSGTVLFTVTLAGAQVAVGQVAVGSLGQASFTYTPSAAGAFVVTATYSGDKNFSSANASANRTVVASALTMGAISPAVVNLGGRVTLSALMAPADQSGFGQNGTVDFVLPNGTLVARATIADSQVTASGRLYTKVVDTGIAGNNLRAGTASIRAVYVPGPNDTYPQITTDPQSLVINRQATDTLLTASPMTSLAYGTPITFNMSTSPRVAPGSADTTIPFASGGSLSLFSGTNLLQRLPVSGNSATATFTIPALNSGAQSFTAVYSGDSINFNGSTSAAVTLNIAKASTAITLSPASGASFQVGTAAKFSATVSTPVTATIPSGTVQFLMGGVAIGSPVALSGGSASINFTPTRSGLGALTATYSGDGNFSASTASSNLQFRARQPFFVVASQAGSTFMTYDSRTRQQISIFQPLGPSYAGGFRVATGDINGDGVADIAYTTSTGSFVRLMDGRSGASLGGFTAYATNYTRPVNLAIADINGDGRGDIITAPGGAGLAANVRAFSGLNYGLIFNKTVLSAGFKGGVSVAGADVDRDGRAEIICAPFSAGGPRVQVYNAAGTLLRDQTLFATTSTTGYSVTATDLNGDGKAEILLGAMSGAQQVVVTDGATGALIGSIAAFTTGSRLATVDDIDGDGIRDILVASGVNGQSQVKRYSGRTLQQIDSFFAYASTNAARNKGLFIG